MFRPLEVFIGLRYTRAKRRNHFISFISLVSILGIAVGVTALITVISVMNGFDKELKERILGMVSHATIEGIGESVRDWPKAIEIARANPHVRGAAPYVERQAMLQGTRVSGAIIRGVDTTMEPTVSEVGTRMVEGKLDELVAGKFGIVLGKELAMTLGVGVGDLVTVFAPEFSATPIGAIPRMKRFTVVGVFEAGMQEYDSGLAVIAMQDAETLYRLDGPTGIRLRLDDMFQAYPVGKELAGQLGQYYRVTDWMQGHSNFFKAVAMEKKVMFLILSLIVAVAAFNLVSTLVMGLFAGSIKPMLDNLFVARDPNSIFWMPIIIVAIFAARSVAIYLTDYGTAYIGRGVVQQLRQQVFDHYLRLPAAFFDAESSGHQIARITYSSEQVAQATTEAVKIAVVDGLSIVFYISVMLRASVQLTLALLVMVPLVGALVVYVGRRYRRISHRIQASMGTVSGVVEETVGANREVKVFGGQAYESARFNEVSEQTRRLGIKVAATNGLASSLVQMIAAVSLALIIYFATRPAMLSALSPGSFTSLILAMGGILPSLKRLTTVQANLQRGIAAAEEIFGLIDTPPERDDGRIDMM